MSKKFLVNKKKINNFNIQKKIKCQNGQRDTKTETEKCDEN